MNYMGFDSYQQVRLRNEQTVHEVQQIRLGDSLRAKSERRLRGFIGSAWRDVVSLVHKRATFAR